MVEGFKQVALYLHCLGPADRKWLLRQLRREQRVLLTKTLRELDQLGIPATTSLFGYSKSGVENGKDSITETRPDTQVYSEKHRYIEIIDSASTVQLKKVLLSEPDWMVANLLSMKQWTWESNYMSIFSSKKRNHLSNLSKSAGQGLSETAKNAMLFVISEKIQEAATGVGGSHNTNGGWVV